MSRHWRVAVAPREGADEYMASEGPNDCAYGDGAAGPGNDARAEEAVPKCAELGVERPVEELRRRCAHGGVERIGGRGAPNVARTSDEKEKGSKREEDICSPVGR